MQKKEILFENTWEMQIKTIFVYREVHLSADIEKEILRIFPQKIPRS